jgi:signal transduction histidine kinase
MSRDGDSEFGDGQHPRDRPQEWTLWGAIRNRTPEFLKRSYATKYLVSFLFVVLLITGIGTATFFQIQSTIEDDAADQLRSNAQLRAEMVSQWVRGMETQTRLLASSDVFTSGDRTQIGYYLARSKSRTALDIVAIHYANATDGRIVESTNVSAQGQSLATIDAPWTDQLAGNVSTASRSRVVATSDAYRVGNSTAVAFLSRTPNDGTVLVVVGSVGRQVEQFDRSNTQSTALLDENASVVLAGEGMSANDTAGFSRARDLDGVELVETETHLRAYAPVNASGWIAVTTAEKSRVYAVADAVGSNVTRIIISSILSLSVIGFMLGRQTVVPLVRLRRRTEEMQDDLDVDLSTDRQDEIGRLYRGFARMRDALRQQIHEAEQARQQAEASRRELQRQNERLDQFASTLSHDLRNPLAVARGHVELLRTEIETDAEQPEPAHLQEHVDAVDDAHDRIDSIISDVLMLTREGEHVEETIEVDLEDIAHEAWTNIDNRAASLHVEDTYIIEADRNRLLRVFENLFRNAIDHVGEDVTVTVGLLEDGFYLQDDGPGIPPDEVDEIFEYGHTTSDDGTGLGLSIVKTIVEAHGWTIAVDTDAPGGARFTVTDVFEEGPTTDTEFEWEEDAFEWGLEE